jgi:hypothetical protein
MSACISLGFLSLLDATLTRMKQVIIGADDLASIDRD